MYHFLQLLKAILYTVLIIGVPTVIATGGNIPHWLWGNPVYQFAIIFVFAYAAGPVISDYFGHHVGTGLFFPNRPNLGHPTISHIISLMSKQLYKEALEELRMLTEIHPTDFRAYKMLLNITAIFLPDQGLFDMFYRKGMQNLLLEEEKNLLQRYRDELIELKQAKGESWPQVDSLAEEVHTRHFYANRKHSREKAKTIVESHSATLPPREQKSEKEQISVVDDENLSVTKKVIVPHHFHASDPNHHHHAPLILDVHSIILEKNDDTPSQSKDTHTLDNSIEHFVTETKEEPNRFRFIRPR